VPKAAKGLYDVLVRGIEFETAVLRDATTGLHLLPAMREAPLEAINPGLLASARMAAVFTFMKRQYDTIIVSAPPLLPVVDGRLLADHADRIVFVMSWTSTPKQLARRALKALGASRQRIAGVIMSGSDPESAETPATRRAA
jgi:Mrp family chromosome partitioning ATPase